MKMMDVLKKSVKLTLDRIRMADEFFHDYRHYRRWNYNNPRVKTKAAQESKILRQTHMIEKAMSLSFPREGFGQQKIKILFHMLDEYIDMGFPTDGVPFQDAVHVLNEYVRMQRKIGYENNEMIEKLKTYDKYLMPDLQAGIASDTKTNLFKQKEKEFPKFFASRHSMRQFAEGAVNVDDVIKAVEIAQRAPTACNRQASKVYLYTDKDVNDRLSELIAGNTGFEKEVQNYLVVTADVSAFYNTFERNQIYVEAGIFTMALVQGLHYNGIASCVLQNGEYYKTNKEYKEVCRNIPDSERIILFIAIGYYKEEFAYAVSLRKNVEDVLIVK